MTEQQKNQQQKKREKLLKKRFIVPERIWSKETESRGEQTTRWFIKYGNCIFSGFQEPDFKEGERVEITYDANSKYEQVNEEGKKTFFFNLITKRISNREIMERIKKIEERLDLLESGKVNTFSPEDLKEEDIPTVEDEDTL